MQVEKRQKDGVSEGRGLGWREFQERATRKLRVTAVTDHRIWDNE